MRHNRASLDALRREVSHRPRDADARVALARALVRHNLSEDARALLDEGESLLAPDPLVPSSSGLAALRRARFDLGFFRFEHHRSLEFSSWPTRHLKHLWTDRIDRTWAWRRDGLIVDRDMVLIQARRQDRTYHSILHAFSLTQGTRRWQHAREALLYDATRTLRGVLTLWRAHGQTTLETLSLEDGRPNQTLSLDRPVIPHRPLLALDENHIGLLLGHSETRPQLARFNPQAFTLEEDHQADHRGVDLVCFTLRNDAYKVAHTQFNRLLEVGAHVLGAWRDTHGREHLIFVWLLEHEGHDYRIRCRLLRVFDFNVTEISLPERYRHEPVLPRFYRVRNGWAATLEYHRLKVDKGPRVLPLGPITTCAPDIWSLVDGQTHVTTQARGHAGASESLIAGGVFWRMNDAPPRIITYKLLGNMPGRNLISLRSNIRPQIEPMRIHGDWDRKAPLAARHIVPAGPYVLVIEPHALSCYQLS